jgi:hypothetical protein
MASNPIGDIPVIISGDFSDLSDAIGQAVSQATDGASSIADAFSAQSLGDGMVESLGAIGDAADAASGQVTSFGDDASGIADSLSALGDAVGSASDGVTSLGDSFTGVSDAVSGVSDDLSGVADAASSAGDALSSAGDDASGFGDAMDAIDVSGIADDLSSVGDAASSAGEALGGIDDDASSADDALSSMADSASSAGDAASSMGDDASAGGDAVETMGENSEEAGGQLAELAEQMAAVGEALVITEGLSELGEEALSAAGTVQSVTIGLTALTGSATQANEIIEQVKNLAATEPFAFPEIAPTVQKMVALGVSAEQIPIVMQAAADASAATGNSFQQVANSIDRMALSGTAGARQLTQLGVSAQQMADIMGVSAAQFTNAFKALDQSQRLDVLTQAMQKFGGTAMAEAQGIAGQWQIFQNQFEEVMVGVGTALTPVVSDILSFGKAVLSGIADATTAFGELPAPVQDVVVAIGLLAAAAVPVAGALAAVGLAMSGLQTLMPSLTALWATLTDAEGEEATAATANAAAHTAASTAVTEGQTAMATTAGVASGAFVTQAASAEEDSVALGLLATASQTAAGSSGFAGLNAALASAGLTVTSTGEVVGGLTAATEGAGAAAGGLSAALGPLGVAAAALGIAFLSEQEIEQKTIAVMNAMANTPIATPAQAQQIATLTAALQNYNAQVALSSKQQITLPQFNPTAVNALNTYIAALQKAGSGITQVGMDAATTTGQLQTLTSGGVINITTALASLATATTPVSTGIKAIVDEVNKQNTAASQAQETYNTLNAALQNNTTLSDGEVVTQQMVDAALNKVVSTTNAASEAAKAHTTASGAEKDSLDSVNKAAAALIATYDTAEATYGNVAAAQDGSLQATAALAIAEKNLDAATKALYGSQQQLASGGNSVAAAVQAIFDKVTNANAALQTAVGVFNAVAIATNNGSSNTAAYNDALNALVTAYKAANPMMDGSTQSLQAWTQQALAAAGGTTNLGSAHDSTVTIIRNGQSTVQQVPTDFNSIGTAAGNAQGPVAGLGTTHAAAVAKIGAGHGTLQAAVTDINNLGFASTNAQTPEANLEQTTGKLIEVVGGGQDALNTFVQTTVDLGTAATDNQDPISNLGIQIGTLQTTIQDANGSVTTFTQYIQNLGNAASDAETPVSNLGPVAANTGDDFADAQGNLQPFYIGLNNLGQGAYAATGLLQNLSAQTDIFDTSQIKVTADVNTGKDAIDGYTSSMQFYGTTAESILGPMNDLTTAINNQAAAWTNDATAANNAAAATSKGGSGKGQQTFEGTTPDTLQAIQQFLSYAGTSAASLYGVTNGAFGVGVMGNPQTGQLGAGAGPQTTAQQNAGNAVIPGGFIGAAEKGPSLTGNAPPPPVYGAGSGVAGTPMVLVSNDGGSTWQDAGYGDYPSGGDVTSAVTGVATQLQSTADTMSTTSESAVSLTTAAQTLTTQINQLNGAVATATTATSSLTFAPGYGINPNGTIYTPAGGQTPTLAQEEAEGYTPPGASTTAPTTSSAAPSSTTETVTDTGPVWSGPQGNPSTGVLGSPIYAVTGSGTSASPFEWAPSGQDFAGGSTPGAATGVAPVGSNLAGLDVTALNNLANAISAAGGTLLGTTTGNQPVTTGIDANALTSILSDYFSGAMAASTEGGMTGPIQTYSTSSTPAENDTAELLGQIQNDVASQGQSFVALNENVGLIGTAFDQGLANLSNIVSALGGTLLGTTTGGQPVTTAPTADQSAVNQAVAAWLLAGEPASSSGGSIQATSANQYDASAGESYGAYWAQQAAAAASSAPTSPTLTPQQMESLVNSSLGSGAALPSAPQAQPQLVMNVTVNNPQLNSGQNIQQVGTQLINVVRQNASALKFSWQ